MNQWYHIAVVRSGNLIYLFVDGNLLISGGTAFSETISSNAAPLTLGAENYSSSYMRALNGYLANVRITKGVARYIANFTPPVDPYPNYSNAISGVISESLAADTFIARAYNIKDGKFVGESRFTGTNEFTIVITANAPACYVTVIPDQGIIWQAATVYALNEKVFPTNPDAKPYYYKRLTAGTSGANEPVWPTTPGGQVADGAVSPAWELVAELTHPITRGPLIPV